METAVSAPNPVDAAGSGRSNGVYGPPFPLISLYLFLVLSAGVGTPRDFMAPDTCDATVTAGSGTLNLTSAPPLRYAREHFALSGLLPYRMLSFTCVLLLVPSAAV
jgi:hypothetical protein